MAITITIKTGRTEDKGAEWVYILKVSEITLPENNVELISKKLQLQDLKINISSVYRRPNTTINEEIELINTMQKTIDKDETLIIGDFIFPSINWDLNTGTCNNTKLMLVS